MVYLIKNVIQLSIQAFSIHHFFVHLFKIFISMIQIQPVLIYCYRWLFDDQNILRFPNLKSLDFTRCGSVEPVIRSLLYLVEHQLDELTLTFDQYVFRRFHHLALHFLHTSRIKYMNVVESQ